jgi:hypothetical protein
MVWLTSIEVDEVEKMLKSYLPEFRGLGISLTTFCRDVFANRLTNILQSLATSMCKVVIRMASSLGLQTAHTNGQADFRSSTLSNCRNSIGR